MSNNAVMNAEKREAGNRGSVKLLRREGGIPATIYGPGREPESLTLNKKEVLSVVNSASGANFLVDLNIAGSGKQTSLIQEIQYHPVSRVVLHVDFLAVSATTTITSNVPIEAVGDAAGVKAGGILDQASREIQVECLPKNLPNTIEVDVSELEIGKSLHLSEVVLPEGVTATSDPETVIFHIVPPRVEEEEAEAEGTEEDAPTSPEAIKEKSDAPEGDA